MLFCTERIPGFCGGSGECESVLTGSSLPRRKGKGEEGVLNDNEQRGNGTFWVLLGRHCLQNW